MSKHTPGPWNTVSDPCHYDTLSIVTAGEKMIVHVGGCCEPAEQEANARLIAAAPELLEALEELINIEGPQPGTALWADKTRALIAKAKGEI